MYSLVWTSPLITHAVVLHKKPLCLATQQRPLLIGNNVCRRDQRVSFMWSRIILSLGNGWISFTLSPCQSFSGCYSCLASLNARRAEHIYAYNRNHYCISAKIPADIVSGSVWMLDFRGEYAMVQY